MMAIDAKDVGELQRALNDAAGKASVLWTTFITFELYLAIAFSSVTHRDLFLENPIKLPVLNVELPLVGFFVMAPTLLVIFHFYVFLQLLALAKKAQDYAALLQQAAPEGPDRQYLRQRLDSFLILQFLAGPAEQRTGFGGFSLRLIAWITLVGAPILILLQGQVQFLPYHKEWVVWLERLGLLFDLAVIWYFWVRVRSDDEPILAQVPSQAWPILSVAASFCVFLFSINLATFPGEWVDEHIPNVRIFPTFERNVFPPATRWLSLHDLLFAGAIDEVNGKPRSWFSNRLVLTGQSFYDHDKHDKVEVSRSFRGRDLRQVVLTRADLRKADFTGAMMNGAQLEYAKLQNARFVCADTGKGIGCVWLQGASLSSAKLQGAFFNGAHLQHASLNDAQLQGATLAFSNLQGANLKGAHLEGVWLYLAQLQGASLNTAQLQGAYMVGTNFQGADLRDAQLQGAVLSNTHLQGTHLSGAQLQAANLGGARLQGASLAGARVWRAREVPDLDITDLDQLDTDTKPWGRSGEASAFATWRDSILKDIPEDHRGNAIPLLSSLDPDLNEPKDLLTAEFWENARSRQPQGEIREKNLAAFLADLACLDEPSLLISTGAAPYLARGLLKYDRMKAIGTQIATVADRLRKGKSDPAACPGVKGFTDEDWALLTKLVADAQKPKPAAKPGQ